MRLAIFSPFRERLRCRPKCIDYGRGPVDIGGQRQIARLQLSVHPPLFKSSMGSTDASVKTRSAVGEQAGRVRRTDTGNHA
jgi:hypothetical protein